MPVALGLLEDAASVATLELALGAVAPTTVLLVRTVAAIIVVVAAPPAGDAARILALEVGLFAFGLVWRETGVVVVSNVRHGDGWRCK